VSTTERLGLWDNDVVEAFIATDPGSLKSYTEYEWAPTGEHLDLKLDPAGKDFPWSSGMESAVTVDETAKVWRVKSAYLHASSGGNQMADQFFPS
jgi:hypothetical protein